MGPGDLSAAVGGLFQHVQHDPNILVGCGTLDDAGVYKIGPSQALVQTVDFITPVVDNPFQYGEIAVANALSDIWAMGGCPITALNVACFPEGLDTGIVSEILQGGLAKFTEAGAALLGGHTVVDNEIKYGASVTGLIDPAHIFSNSGAKAGDLLVLTKALGTGVVTTAGKEQKASEEILAAAIESMRQLNNISSDTLRRHEAHACTDVTGFGLIGHLTHIARESEVTAVVRLRDMPFLLGALELRRKGIGPGGLERNRAYYGEGVQIRSECENASVDLLFDPQTSGGLLIAVKGDNAAALVSELLAEGRLAAIIGEILPQTEHRILLV